MDLSRTVRVQWVARRSPASDVTGSPGVICRSAERASKYECKSRAGM